MREYATYNFTRREIVDGDITLDKQTAIVDSLQKALLWDAWKEGCFVFSITGHVERILDDRNLTNHKVVIVSACAYRRGEWEVRRAG